MLTRRHTTCAAKCQAESQAPVPRAPKTPSVFRAWICRLTSADTASTASSQQNHECQTTRSSKTAHTAKDATASNSTKNKNYNDNVLSRGPQTQFFPEKYNCPCKAEQDDGRVFPAMEHWCFGHSLQSQHVTVCVMLNCSCVGFSGGHVSCCN